jgi:hypothetical protein
VPKFRLFFLEESDGQQSHQYQQNKQDFALWS